MKDFIKVVYFRFENSINMGSYKKNSNKVRYLDVVIIKIFMCFFIDQVFVEQGFVVVGVGFGFVCEEIVYGCGRIVYMNFDFFRNMENCLLFQKLFG